MPNPSADRRRILFDERIGGAGNEPYSEQIVTAHEQHDDPDEEEQHAPPHGIAGEEDEQQRHYARGEEGPPDSRLIGHALNDTPTTIKSSP